MKPNENFGVLLVNLGTPTEPTAKAVRQYLAEFLSDKRVISIPMIIWKCILHGIILRLRPARVAKLYAKIWSEKGSPIRYISLAQASALQRRLATVHGRNIPVALGMTYGSPSLIDGLLQLRKADVERVVVFPLYPQYSATTTAAVHDGICRSFAQCRHIPRWDMIRDYYNHPLYIQALAESIRPYMEGWDDKHRLLISFHGIPKAYADKGDPYPSHCEETTRLLVADLGLTDIQFEMAYQSRFGKQEWLKPYADLLLEEWAKQGIKHVVVVCPGFAADCLETLEEISEEFKEIFLSNGGQSYHYIPALNESSNHIDMMVQLVDEHLS